MYWTKKELENRLDKIEQKDKYINSLLQYTNDLETQLQQKENIIKEVREYIENNNEKQYGFNYEYGLNDKDIKELLEILDKGE